MADNSLIASLTSDGKVVDTTSESVKKGGTDALGKDAFLKLLVTQMQYQDPLNPQADTEFVAQLAQFSALEQMQNISSTTMNSQAFSLLGKEVVVSAVTGTGETTEVQGYVDYVVMQNNKAYLSIDGGLYPIDNLREVLDIAYSVQKLLPSVEETSLTYNRENPADLNIKVDFGKDDYKASSIAVGINGTVIDKEYLSFDGGVLTVKKEALADLDAGRYNLIVMFDDPLYTTITDKVFVQVTGSAPAAEQDDSEPTDDQGNPDVSEGE